MPILAANGCFIGEQKIKSLNILFRRLVNFLVEQKDLRDVSIDAVANLLVYLARSCDPKLSVDKVSEMVYLLYNYQENNSKKEVINGSRTN